MNSEQKLEKLILIETTNESSSSKKINLTVIICNSSLYEKSKTTEKFTVDSLEVIFELANTSGFQVVSTQFVPDDRVLLTKQVGNAISSSLIDAIIVCGGTGLCVSEITLESLRPLMVKTMPGFAEILRTLSYDQLGSTAITVRALAGVTDHQKLLFCLPNSSILVKLALDKLVFPEIRNISDSLRLC